jgi:hypothetical protein
MDEHFLKEGAHITNQIINLTFNKSRIFYNYRIVCDYDWRKIPIVTLGYHSSKNQIRIYLLDLLTAETEIVMTKKFGANPNYHCGTLISTTGDWPLHTINNNILFLDQAHYINDFSTFLNFTLATALSNYFDIINVAIGNAISQIPDLLGSSGHYLSAIYYLEETLLETQSKLFALAQNSVSYVSASIQNVDFKDFNIQYSAVQDHCRFNVTTDNVMSVSVDHFDAKLAHYAPNIETVIDPHFTTTYTPDIYWHSPTAELIFDFYFPNVTHVTKFNDFVVSRYLKIDVQFKVLADAGVQSEPGVLMINDETYVANFTTIVSDQGIATASAYVWVNEETIPYTKTFTHVASIPEGQTTRYYPICCYYDPPTEEGYDKYAHSDWLIRDDRELFNNILQQVYTVQVRPKHFPCNITWSVPPKFTFFELP